MALDPPLVSSRIYPVSKVDPHGSPRGRNPGAKVKGKHHLHEKGPQKHNKNLKLINVRFRLSGVPPDQAVRVIPCLPDFTFAEISELIHLEYRLCPTLNIAFIFRGRVLKPTQTLADVGYRSKKIPITMMALCQGG